jgi:hypothetical protein
MGKEPRGSKARVAGAAAALAAMRRGLSGEAFRKAHRARN